MKRQLNIDKIIRGICGYISFNKDMHTKYIIDSNDDYIVCVYCNKLGDVKISMEITSFKTKELAFFYSKNFPMFESLVYKISDGKQQYKDD